MNKIIWGGKTFEIQCHDQGKMVVISATPSVACSVIHDHDDCTPTFKQNHNMQGVSHIHTSQNFTFVRSDEI